MINILHSIDTIGPGGAEKVFLTLAKALEERRTYRNFVVIPGKGWVYDELKGIGLEPILLNARGSFNIKYLYALIRIVKKLRINVIQSHLLGSNVYCSLAGKICGIPVISTFHGFVDAESNDKLLINKLRIVNWGSAWVVFVSNHLKSYFDTHFRFNDKKVKVIYNGIELHLKERKKRDSIRKLLGLRNDDILIGSIGNIREAKGYNYLLEAAARVVKSRPECKFVIVGEGSGKLYDDLLAIKKRMHLEDNLFFVGFRQDINEILDGLDIFVLSSISEGFSISTIEAMASGIPVICTRSGGPEEIVSPGKDGLLVEPKDPEALAEKILILLRNKTLAEEMGKAGRRHVLENFTVETMIEKYQGLYERNFIGNSYQKNWGN